MRGVVQHISRASRKADGVKQHDSGDSHQQGRNRAGGNASKPLGSIKCLSGHGYFLN
jgi:hypothetical protein